MVSSLLLTVLNRSCTLVACTVVATGLLCPMQMSAADAVAPVIIEGSSTVYPITTAVCDQLSAQSPPILSQVVISGTSAGMRRLVAGEIPIANASRPINKEEAATAASHGISLIELPIALDAITFVVNPSNTFVTSLTTQELRRLWQPGSTITTWAQLHAGWPDVPIDLFSMGKDSGTFDFMTETIVGTARSIRGDLVGSSQDPQQLIQDIVTHKHSIGYFGYAYYRQNASMLRAVPIDDGHGAVLPSGETILNRTYHPLSRTLFIYVNRDEAEHRHEVAALVEGYLHLLAKVVPQVGYVALDEHTSALVSQRFTNRITGSAVNQAHPNESLEELLARTNGASPAADAGAAHAEPDPNHPPTTGSVASATPASSGHANTTAARELVKNATTLPTSALDLPDELQQLRSLTLDLARISLDEKTTLSDLDRAEDLVRESLERVRGQTLDPGAAGGHPAPLSEIASRVWTAQLTDNAYADLVNHLQLTQAGHALINEQAFATFKQAALGISDAAMRHKLVMAVTEPSIDNLPHFADVVASLGHAGDANLIVCYARGGMVMR